MKILVWGTGKVAEQVIANGIHGEILGFIETNKSKEQYHGKTVYGIEEIPKSYDFIVAANSYSLEIRDICQKQEIPLNKVIFLRAIREIDGCADKKVIREILGEKNYMDYCMEFGMAETIFGGCAISNERKQNYISAVNIAASICNRECFHSIKNCNEGKEVVLCGAGPTLRKYTPIPSAFHVALNRALLYQNVKYDWFIADDWVGINFFQEELIKYECKKFFGRHFAGDLEREIPESFRRACKAERFYTDSYLVGNGFASQFVCDIDAMAIGNMPNMALAAMQIVLFSNPSKIYLVGCDSSEGHFIQPPSLDDERVRKHEEDLKNVISSDRAIQKWYELKRFADCYYPDVEIVSINPVGLKGIFRDEYQN